jgi:hypothetical protein
VGKALSADDLDWETIEAARRRAPAERVRDGLRLFDRACQVMMAGIRTERPDADPDEVLRVLRERLRIARDLETQ